MHEVLVNRLGGLSLPRKSVVRLTDRPDMTLDVYRGRKTTIQPTNQEIKKERKKENAHRIYRLEYNLIESVVTHDKDIRHLYYCRRIFFLLK